MRYNQLPPAKGNGRSNPGGGSRRRGKREGVYYAGLPGTHRERPPRRGQLNTRTKRPRRGWRGRFSLDAPPAPAISRRGFFRGRFLWRELGITAQGKPPASRCPRSSPLSSHLSTAPASRRHRPTREPRARAGGNRRPPQTVGEPITANRRREHRGRRGGPAVAARLYAHGVYITNLPGDKTARA